MGLYSKGARLPPDGLKQSSWHATILLSATGLLQKISKESKIKEARLANACDSLISDIPSLQNTKVQSTLNTSFPWPEVQLAQPVPAQYYPMAPVWQNEGTNEGTAAIITNYEEIQVGQNPEDPMWSERLVLWHGDVKTILRLRSVQAMRSISGERP
ncbi:hypothetical protein N7G274_007966 [Stereocaulon virgatum]|uniref:DUF6589 domain-containing protein n=1 Tax=Stereocaulon virgatum TaxID=373712 RepID=A0ABR4A105_9LECA